MSIQEPLSTLFTTDDFGTAATIGGSSVNGIFDDAFIDPFGEVESTEPTFYCRSSDVSSVSRGDTVTINSTSYNVVGVHQDGLGVTLLKLEKQ